MSTLSVVKPQSWSCELWKSSYQALACECGEKPTCIIFSHGFTNIQAQTDWVRKNLGWKVIWCDQREPGIRKRFGYILSDFASIKAWLDGIRKDKENLIFSITFMAANHTFAYWIKKWWPKSRVICHFYDAMDLWVPPESRHLWDDFDNTKGSNWAEYAALAEIRKGLNVDGFLYKDWGPDSPWPYLQAAGKPMVWCPSAPSRKIFQDPQRTTNAPRFIYIGTIVPPSSHDRPSKLFGDIFMEDVFERATRQGFEIHAYLSIWNKQTIEEIVPAYHRRFTNGQVKLFNGAYLDRLLPRLAGRYRWGWMLYHFPQPAILPLIANTLPTKVATYLALGVPIVVSEEFEVVARIVKKYGIGIVLNNKQIDHLTPFLEAADYPAMLKAIKIAREDFCSELSDDCLGRLIKQMLLNPPSPGPAEDPEWLSEDAVYFLKICKEMQKKGEVRESSWRDTRRTPGLGQWPGVGPETTDPRNKSISVTLGGSRSDGPGDDAPPTDRA